MTTGGTVWLARRGVAGRTMERRRWQGTAGMARLGKARRAMAPLAGHGLTRPGGTRHRRHGVSWHDVAWRDRAPLAWRGNDAQGVARFGRAKRVMPRRGTAGKAWRDGVELGTAGIGTAGDASLGDVGEAVRRKAAHQPGSVTAGPFLPSFI